jgi:hypothetical protein
VRSSQFTEALEAMTRRAQIPGWRAYTRARAKELDADPMFIGIYQALKEKLAEIEAKEVK